MDSAAAAARWAEVWQRAWEARDTDAIMALYADGVILSTQPFREPRRGSSSARDYVSHAFSEEERPRVWVGQPVVEGNRAAIEWWAATTENGQEITLVGTSVLRFDSNGLVTEQRDTWNQADGRREPPDGWGR